MTTQTERVDVLNVLGFHAEMREASGKPNLARELLDARAAMAQLIEDNRNALRILENDGQGSGPLAGFLRAAIARIGGDA
jgi:hypothetical protein